MTADDLSAPLGRDVKRRRRLPFALSRMLPHAVDGGLALFLGVFVLWAVVGDDPLGGEPMTVVPIDLQAAMAAKKPAPIVEAANPPAPAVRQEGGDAGPATLKVPPAQPGHAGNTRTVTIIDGKTGTRQDVAIPAGNAGAGDGDKPEQKFVEMTSHG